MLPSTLPPGVMRAPPLWAISAEHSADHLARMRHRRGAEAVIAALVTKYPVPWFGEPVTASARTLERLATSQGMTTRLHVGLESCTLEGRVGEQRLGFRAVWRRGKADFSMWYEPEARWAMVHDPRPVGVSKLTRVALAGKRGAGLDEYHLKLMAGPTGVLVSFSELSARVRALS